MKGKLAENWLKLVRLYTFYSPVRKGKVRLYRFALGLCSEKPGYRPTDTFDGRRINVSLASEISDHVYFLGEYELEISKLVLKIIKPGDICFDVGANYGWYASMFAKHAGTSGQVHAFEPLPDLYERLQANMALAKTNGNVFLNQMALGNETKAVTIYTFPELTTGHNSLSPMGQENHVAVDVPMATMNSYLADNKIERVDFLKIDIEGAELLFLEGAEALFKLERPPVLLAEMALNTSKGFGYVPNDLIVKIRSYADYKFFVISEWDGTLTEIDSFDAEDPGANVLCIPQVRMADLSYLF